MFRFSASPLPITLRRREQTNKTNLHRTTIPIPQFTYNLTPNNLREGSSEYFASTDKIVVQDNEDERDVDWLDVLLETYTKREEDKADDTSESSHATGLYRDSFRLILPTMPRHDKSLHRLRISQVDWRVFVELLLVSSFVDTVCTAFVPDENGSLELGALMPLFADFLFSCTVLDILLILPSPSSLNPAL